MDDVSPCDNLCDRTPSLDKWHDHIAVEKTNSKKIERGVMDGTIPSAVVYSGTTFNVGKYGDGLHLTGKPSYEVFKVSTRHEAQATETETMEHKLREPVNTFGMVPGVFLGLLASTSKFCDAVYVTVFDEDEFSIYNAETTTITASKKPILKRWRNCVSTLWRIPLVK